MRAELAESPEENQEEDPSPGRLLACLRHLSFVLTLGLVVVVIFVPGVDSFYGAIAYTLGVFAGEIEEVVWG